MNAKTDSDGEWQEEPQASGAIVRKLIAPSAAFDAKRAAEKTARPELHAA